MQPCADRGVMKRLSIAARVVNLLGALVLGAACHGLASPDASIDLDTSEKPWYVRTVERGCTVFSTHHGLLLTAKHCLDGLRVGQHLELSGGRSEERTACVLGAHEEWDLAVLWDRSGWSSGELRLPTGLATGTTITFIHYQFQRFKRGTMSLTGSTVEDSFEGVGAPQSACPGDSGGPAFIGKDFRTVYGVISKDSMPGGECGARTSFVNLSHSEVRGWVRSTWLDRGNTPCGRPAGALGWTSPKLTRVSSSAHRKQNVRRWFPGSEALERNSRASHTSRTRRQE